ncbi:MAG: XTP/dITP diphosphatase [Clostridiales bacterium]|nr:XTP/dITP diphosphatase [Clostridiales bacterium]
MKKLIIASNNKNKVQEIKSILKEINIEVKSLKEENIDLEVIEDGKTFEENALKKAKEIALYLKKQNKNDCIILADDSGLEVEYLNNEPGIYSARYSGIHGDDKKNNEKLINKLKGVPMEKRNGKFVCVIAVADIEGRSFTIRGEVEGIILDSLQGKDGFGYDPLFYYEPLKKTFAELDKEEKNKISHRGVALKQLKEKIIEML